MLEPHQENLSLGDCDWLVGMRWRRPPSQQRAYGPTVYDAELTFTGRNIGNGRAVLVYGCHPTLNIVKAVARIMVGPYFERHEIADAMEWHFAPQLQECDELARGPGWSRWRVLITQACTD